MIAHIGDARWGHEGSSSYWYPTVKIFRQPEAYDWMSAFEAAAEDIRKRINA